MLFDVQSQACVLVISLVTVAGGLEKDWKRKLKEGFVLTDSLRVQPLLTEGAVTRAGLAGTARIRDGWSCCICRKRAGEMNAGFLLI